MNKILCASKCMSSVNVLNISLEKYVGENSVSLFLLMEYSGPIIYSRVFFLRFVFLFVFYVYECLPVCISVHLIHVWCPQRSEKGSEGPPRSGVTVSSHHRRFLSCRCKGLTNVNHYCRRCKELKSR